MAKTEEKLVAKWKGRIEACERLRKKLEPDWKTSVNYRAGEPFDEAPDTDTIFVPTDAALTKQKVASLFSQVPAVGLSPQHPKYAAAAPVFAKKLNHVLEHDVKIHSSMEEVLGDVINAAGVGVVEVGYTATFETVQVPAVDLSTLPPGMAEQMLAAGQIPMSSIERPVYEAIYGKRISPSAFLWPAEFKGSDFQTASWLGYTGEMSWADAQREFKLSDDDKEKVTGGGDSKELTLSENDEAQSPDKVVRFHKIYYRCSTFDAKEKDPRKIKVLVLVDGLDKPAVIEDLQWQRYVPETRQWIGIQGFPIKVLTLQYISDRAIPPSDSKIGRPQVRELMRSRSQMILQRDRSTPLRWYDTNRLDPMVGDKLRRGEWLDFIPTNGNGDKSIGEVSRAQYPAEDWQFDRVAKDDLQTAWAMGDNQAGRFASGERSAAEAKIVQSAAQTLIGFQRAKVARFFLSIAEAVAGLIVLFGLDSQEELLQLGEQGAERLSQSDLQLLPVNCVFSVKQDAAVLLDVQSRQAALERFINLTAKSGVVELEPVIAEMASLAGLDPTHVMKKPQAPPPEPSNLSMRLSGVEDLANPITIALLMKSGQAPSADEIKAAKLLLADAATPLQPQVTSAPVPQGQLPPAGNTLPEEMSTMPRMERITQTPNEVK